MSLAIVLSRAQVGVEAPAVTVETHLANGLPCLTLVGLPEGALSKRIYKFYKIKVTYQITHPTLNGLIRSFGSPA